MRLMDHQIHAIRNAASRIVESKAHVRVFGTRFDYWSGSVTFDLRYCELS